MNHSHLTKLGVVCLVMMLLAAVNTVSSTTKKDRPSMMKDGHTLYVGGSNPGNYSKIQDAIDNASDGDTVFVYDDSAPYYENIAINVSIHLIGENRNTTSIEGGNYAVSIFVDGVTVSGFRISNVGDFWNCCGFYVISQRNNISNNNIVNNLRMNGIYLDGASYNTIYGNLIENNNYHGIRLEYTSHNIIMNNRIVNNRGFGILLAESGDNLLIGNTVKQSFNDGLSLGDNCVNNTIFHNNFIDNQENAYDETGNTWDNGSSGNYWSDYNGSDNDGDGIGDSPYQIPGNISQDMYPLMKPYAEQTLDIKITRTGRFGVTITVTNTGTNDVTNVDWNSRLNGGFLLVPSERYHQGTLSFLAPGQEIILQKVDVFFGIGIIDVQVTVGEATASMQGFLLLFFFISLSE
ncbi:MAG: right-handed parallel beta-helix repeat-containing protein [Euryarchaeota archaeon]|nr:right-handed parallel beta-helix repeat-containing protein [Euryarchaeota archaeon]